MFINDRMNIRGYIKEVIGFLLVKFLYNFVKNKIKVNAIYFHSPSPHLFKSMIKWYHNKGYRFIDIEEFYLIEKGEKICENKVVFISFDDGRRSNMDLLTICEEYDVPITIFVTTEAVKSGYYWWDIIRKYCNNSEVERVKNISNTELNQILSKYSTNDIERVSIDIKELKMLNNHKLVNIQAHTKTHALLPMCNNLELIDELQSSKEELEMWLNKKIKYFAYPCGHFSQTEIDAVEEAGYVAAFTTRQNYLSPGNDNMLLIPRMEINCTGGGYYENMAKAIGVWKFIK